MIPPSLLLRLATLSDLPRSNVRRLPKNAKPLDVVDLNNPYVGQIYYNFETHKCYQYYSAGWKELNNG